MVGDLSLGYLVDTTMQRGYRVPISLFMATRSVNAQMSEVLPPPPPPQKKKSVGHAQKKKSVVLPEDLTIACEFCFCIPSASAYLLVSLVPNNHFRQGFR